MKIVILGDSHDHHENLKKAVALANEHECALMLHTGDLGAPGICVNILSEFNGPVKMVLGNNDHEIVGLMRKTYELDNFELVKSDTAGDTYEDTIDGVNIFMHHYPRMAELAAASGEYDLCLCGHTHEYRAETVGHTLLLNPSAIIPTNGPASMVVYDTITKTHERIMM